MKELGLPRPKSSPLSLEQAGEGREEAEHRRELALRSELIRQEKLEQLARRFDRKAAMRETWLNENQRLVAQVMGAALGGAGDGKPCRAPRSQRDKPLHRPCGPTPCDWMDQDSHLKKNSPGFICLFVCFLGLRPWHMEVPRLGVSSELQPPTSTTATATPDPSHVCDLHHSSRQCHILNPLSKAKD